MRSIRSSIEEFRKHWRNYLIQSAIATCAIFVVILLLQSFNMVIVASIGASTFVVFVVPKHITAKYRKPTCRRNLDFESIYITIACVLHAVDYIQRKRL